jgi:hypothetical protein
MMLPSQRCSMQEEGKKEKKRKETMPFFTSAPISSTLEIKLRSERYFVELQMRYGTRYHRKWRTITERNTRDTANRRLPSAAPPDWG